MDAPGNGLLLKLIGRNKLSIKKFHNHMSLVRFNILLFLMDSVQFKHRVN